MIDPWLPPYSIRPGQDCSAALAQALAASAATGDWVDLSNCEPGEYPVYPVTLTAGAWTPVVAGGRPGVQMPSGAKLRGAPGRVLVDMAGMPWCMGIVGVYAHHGLQLADVEIEGVEVCNRGAGVTSAGLPYTGDHTDGILVYATDITGRVERVTVHRCRSLGAIRGDGVYVGTGTYDVTVSDFVPENSGRYGACIAGNGNGRTGLVFRGIVAPPNTGTGSNQTIHVEAEGTPLGEAGVLIEDCVGHGAVVVNLAPGAILRRVAAHGYVPALGYGRSGGLSIINSPRCLVEDIWLDWWRPPINAAGRLSDERAIRLVGDCSDTVIRDAVVHCRHVEAPNSDPPSALQSRAALPAPASERVTLERVRLYAPTGMPATAGFTASCTLDIDARTI